MPHRKSNAWARKCDPLCAIVLALIVLFSPLARAQTAAPAADVQPDAAPSAQAAATPQADQERILFHIAGAGDNQPTALGINMLLAERFLQTPGLVLVPRDETVDAARKAKIERPFQGIHLKDIPYLCLKTESRRAVIGWFEVNGDTASLSLRAYDGVSTAFQAGETITLPLWRLPELLKQGQDLLARLIGKSASAKDDLDPDLSIATLNELGAGWLGIDNAKGDAVLDALLRLHHARRLGADPQALYAAWLPAYLELSGKALNRRPKAVQALVQDLMGAADKALALYEALPAKTPIGVQNAHLRLLLAKERVSQAQALADRLIKAGSANAETYAISGDLHDAAHNEDAAIDDWSQAIEVGLVAPRLLDKLALAQKQRGRMQLAAAAWSKAATQWDDCNRQDRAVQAGLAALEAGAAAGVWDDLFPYAASDPERERFAALLDADTQNPAPRPVLLARARLARQKGDLDQAASLYEDACARDDDHLPTWFETGLFFTDDRLEIDKAIQYLRRAEKLDENNLDVRAALARIYSKAEFCDKAIPLAQSVAQQRPTSPPSALAFSDVLLACGQIEGAANAVGAIFAYNPEHVPALVQLDRVYRAAKNNASVTANLNRLRAIDPTATQALIDANAPKKEDKPADPVVDETVRRKAVNVTFPVTRELARIIPTTVKTVGLIDMARVDLPITSAIASRLFSPTLLDTEPIVTDFISLLQAQSADVVTDESISEQIEVTDGASPFVPQSLKSVIAAYQLDALALFKLSEDHGELNLDLYLYERDGKEVLHSQGIITSNVDQLQSFNPVVLLIPLLVLAAVAAALVMMKRRGTGELEVAISYSSTFEDGYFAIRLSKRELEQAFPVEGLMKKKFNGTRADTEAKIRAFFASRSPLRALASNKLARLSKVPPGTYFVYIVGIMVNVDTRVPIGSYEVKRQVTIDKDGKERLEVNLEQTEAYIEIKALRQVTRKRKVMEKVDGKMAEVEREVAHFEEVGGVMIEINNNPALTKVTIEGEAVGYYLPVGSYRILATYEDLGAAQLLEVRDTSPQQIDLRLMPRREVKLPEMPKATEPARTEGGLPGFDLDDEPIAPAAPQNPGRSGANRTVNAAPTPSVAPRRPQPSAKPAIVEPIELADDILDGPAPIMLDNSPAVGESTQIPIDIDDLFTASSEMPVSEMMGVGDNKLSEAETRESIRKAEQMQAAGRWEEAAELFLRAGRLDDAADMCQKSGNQVLNYKIYGLSYLRSGQHREAAEMFKYADEPLLEAEALEGLRLFDEANRKRGGYFEQRGDVGRALKHYQKASAFDRIGELHERAQNHDQAGEAFFKARLFDRAAQNFEQAEDIKHAAEAYEMDGNFEKAADLYKRLGSNVKVFNLLEKSGRFFEAAEGYKKFGLLDEAIHACQQVPHTSPDYLKAALIMGKIFTEKGETQLARSVYHKVVDMATIDQSNIEKYYEFGVLIQEQGMIHEAYALFERLQTVKYNYADVTIRLQNLVDQVESERAQYGTAPPPGTVPPFPGYRSATTGLSQFDMATPVPQQGPQTPSSNRYTFEKELGRGAMGIVYMAKDTALDRFVAYKTVSNAIKENPASLKYFLSEAKSLAALNHQNIVTVYDVGQEANNYYITMEFVDGRSLGEFIREKGRLSLKNVVVIATKICSGLEYAHSRNVIHRDIKPTNIMISGQGEVKIMDFGLAKIMNDAVQDKTIVRGTPLYMAPEQVEGVGVDHRSDIYSFGVTLFEMATGTLPFTKGDIAYHHLHTPPPSPVRYNPSIPEGLEKIILKCLEKKKESRYQRVADVKRDLGPLRGAVLKG